MTRFVHRFGPYGCRRIAFIVMLSLAFFVSSNQATFAGDQEGVSGYKFKIYDADGDGIDGNEGNAGSGNTVQSGVKLDLTRDGVRRDVDFVFIAYQLRVLLLGWLR